MMDSFRFGSIQANNFDTANKLKYSDQDGSFSRSSNAATTSNLSAGLDAEADHIVMLQFDWYQQIINVPKATIAALLQDWKFPAVAVDSLFSHTDIEPHGLSSISEGSTSCCWYYLPIAEVTKSKLRYETIRVLQVLHDQPFHVRTLVFYPPSMSSRMQAMLPTLFDELPGFGGLQWPRLHLALVQAAVETWEERHLVILASALLSVRIVIDPCSQQALTNTYRFNK
jgi:hypothetical protein